MTAKRNRKFKRNLQRKKTRQLLPVIVAVSSGLGVLPANALELGEIQVNSALGQPLRASIAYALNPTEQLANYCIYLRPAAATNGIPVFSQAQISVTDSAILLTGNTPIREPMLNMQVAVDCPYTPRLLREYTLLVDPAERIPSESVARTIEPLNEIDSELPTTAATRTDIVRSRAATATRSARPAATDSAPISIARQYRVQPGDTVSTIVARIEGRTVKLWPAVNAIFSANPDAFINNDVNRLMAGKLLNIPAAVGSVPGAVQVASEPAIATESQPVLSAPVSTNIPGTIVTTDGTAAVPALPETNPVVQTASPEIVLNVSNNDSTPVSTTVDQVAQLRPGDVVLPPLDAGEADIIISDTLIEDNTATRAADNGTLSASNSDGARNWLVWLGGSGLALILALLFFGRTLRERFSTYAAGKGEIEGRRADDDPTQRTRVVEDVDYNFEDTVNSQAISLDADLEDGTGLQKALDMDVAQDFGFSSTGAGQSKLDIEVTEYAAEEVEDSPTDVIPPQHRADVASILDREESGDDADEDYNVSMIVDATKHQLGNDDDTAKDLQAIQIDTDTAGDGDASGSYTLSNEVDYQVLEQDYEDELTATQALSAEVAKAAEELARQMDHGEDVAITAEMPEFESTHEMLEPEITREMPAVQKTGDDVTRELAQTEKTREMPAAHTGAESVAAVAEVSNPDHTAELKANLPTTLEAENDADAVDLASATTIELSAAGSDVTVEMIVESGRVDTKKDS